MIQVVVTGMGVVSPVGIGVDEFWRSLCGGVSGIGPITRFDASVFDVRHAGEVKHFAFSGPASDSGRAPNLATQFVLVAAEEALRRAGLGGGPADPLSAGVVLATNFGGSASVESALARGSPATAENGALFSEFPFQAALDRVANRWGLGGPRVALSLSCASGTAAVGYALDLIRSGRARAVLAGGYDELSRFSWSGLCVLRTMTKEKLRPFDRTRAGTIFGEGAGVLLLEEATAARARGAVVLAEVLGHGMNNNAFHMTAPDKEGGGLRRAMAMALADAGTSPAEIDHVNSHGTGTKYNDVTETQAIKALLGERARQIPITAVKSMTGHTMGAAGAMEAIASILSLRDGIIPPTITLENPDPECDLDYTPNVSARRSIRTVLSNSAGIGGCNAAVVFRKPG